MANRPAAVRTSREEGGSALVVTMVAVVILATMIAAGAKYLVYSSQTSTQVFESKDQAYGVARAGIIDALSWFRRQTSQPVKFFTPQRNLAAIPPVNETENPAVGIVRVYSITKSVWARYEIRLVNAAPAMADDTMQDVTTSRGLPGAGQGTVWQVVSHGYVFRRNYKDPNVALNPTNDWTEAAEWDNVNHRPGGTVANGTNTLVSHVRLATEIRRLTILRPGIASLCARTGSTISLGNKSRVSGNPQTGLIYAQATGAPAVVGTLTGVPAMTSIAGYADDWQDIFQMSLQDLLAMPDVKVRDINDLPVPLPDYSLTFYNGSVTFDSTHPLRASAGVLIVNGDLTVDQNSNSFYNGFLYVRGNFLQKAPSSIRGSVIVRGSVNISGLGDYSEIWADEPLLNVILQRMGQYRLSQAIRIGGIDGRNL